MRHASDDETIERGRDDGSVPHWHAPPRPRDSVPAQPVPEPLVTPPAPDRVAAPAVRLRDRLALPLLAVALLIVAAVVLRPAGRVQATPPAPAPAPIIRTVPAPPTVVLPPGVTTIGCLGLYALDAGLSTWSEDR